MYLETCRSRRQIGNFNRLKVNQDIVDELSGQRAAATALELVVHDGFAIRGLFSNRSRRTKYVQYSRKTQALFKVSRARTNFHDSSFGTILRPGSVRNSFHNRAVFG